LLLEPESCDCTGVLLCFFTELTWKTLLRPMELQQTLELYMLKRWRRESLVWAS